MAESWHKFDADRKALFLQLYAKYGLINKSARECGVAPSTARDAIKNDPAFKDAVEQAYEDFKDSLEHEALTRAVFGWEEPVFQKGELCGHIVRKSDRILELMLRRHISGYRTAQQVDMTLKNGVLVVPELPKTVEEWEAQNSG